jgi:CDP-paratose 2-epimerase
MRLFISGICGFVGSSLARNFLARMEKLEICGMDNLLRPGSETNRSFLRKAGVRVLHGDVRSPSDLENIGPADWVIDAAANPSVLAGTDGRSSSRQLMEHNLVGSLNLLEYAKFHGAGLTLLSSSRVYSVAALAALPLREAGNAFTLDTEKELPAGVTHAGIAEAFSTEAPVSLYGSTKLASEIVALEYGATFGFPVWVNRCGVLAGAGQFGTAEQGIFSFWLHAHAARRPLRYIGFGGEGLQVRDALHPDDLADMIAAQMQRGSAPGPRIFNLGGGPENAMSLAQLTAWCDCHFGKHAPTPDTHPRAYDVPWVVMDSGLAHKTFGWEVSRKLPSILEEIAAHVREHPDWLERSGA